MGFRQAQSFAEHLDRWLEQGVWLRSILSWWPHRNHENLLWLRYDDLRTDLQATMTRILAFLPWQLAEDRWVRVMQLCSFNWMRNHGERFSSRHADGTPMFKPGRFIRKGVSGDYRELMQPAQERQIMQMVQCMLPSEAIEFLFGGEVR